MLLFCFCTYLFTKEVATLLDITPDSVKKAKHRLRKKLDLTAQHSWNEPFRY